jgi:hypothetical protein
MEAQLQFMGCTGVTWALVLIKHCPAKNDPFAHRQGVPRCKSARWISVQDDRRHICDFDGLKDRSTGLQSTRIEARRLEQSCWIDRFSSGYENEFGYRNSDSGAPDLY